MSYSLKIKNGDLDLSTNTIGVVTGLDKLIQDLSLQLREQYGIDRFHPSYGSVLDDYIGDEISALTQHEMETETLRILTNYQQAQLIAVQKNPGKYTMDELLNTVNSISCTLSYDVVNIQVHFTTASGLLGSVTGQVGV